MALYIQTTTHYPKAATKTAQWHVGEAIPTLVYERRVVTFQADGDELDLILSAMERTRMKPVKPE